MRYLTTAIDYTNGAPHIGHAYEKVLTDILARFHRLAGERVFFLTGVDQYGQKVQQSAEREGLPPAEFVQRQSQRFLQLLNRLDISNDGWADTTDPRHAACVQTILQRLHDQGQLYKNAYRGFYSVRQEQFLTDKERNEAGEFGPEWGEVVELEEENWYFRLSDHIPWLRGFLDTHPEHVYPANRRSDILNALAKSEGADLSISRPKSRLQWGIPLPFDENFVCYVWFDALVNYLSFAGYLAEETGAQGLPDFSQTWPDGNSRKALHVIGKDILVPPHGIYWPCMLHALGFADNEIPPLLAHGWWNRKNRSGGSEKMSKSLGNVVDPFELVETFGLDAVRYYLARDIVTGKDADFDVERLIVLHNSELANDFGNLCNRSLTMLHRFNEGLIPAIEGDDEACRELREVALTEAAKIYDQAMKEHRLSDALIALNELTKAANRFIEQKAPWALAKDPAKQAELQRTLAHLLEIVAQLGSRYRPFLPQTCEKLAQQLRLETYPPLTADPSTWPVFSPGHQCDKPSPLFPRLELPEAD